MKSEPALFKRARARVVPVELELSPDEMAIDLEFDPTCTIAEALRSADPIDVATGLHVILEELK